MIGPYRLVRPWVRITELFIGGALSAPAEQEVQNFLQGVATTFDFLESASGAASAGTGSGVSAPELLISELALFH